MGMGIRCMRPCSLPISVQRVVRSERERYEAASELFERIGQHGDEAIQTKVRDQLRLLAEHVVDHSLLDVLSQTLEAIERPVPLAATPVPTVETTAQTVTP